MDDSDNISLDEKIQKLGLESCKDILAPKVVDTLYEKYKKEQLNKSNADIILNILNNDILEKLNRDRIDAISDFRITREELLQIDGEKVVKDNWDKLRGLGIRKTKDLYYARRNKTQMYILTVLRGILNFIGYEFKYHQTTKYSHEKQKQEAVFYYNVIKK